MEQISPQISTAPTCASLPFDHPEADIILQTSDRVNFRVFKLFLSLASPVFETMIKLPQPVVETNDNAKDSLPVISVQEHSKTLDTFLRFCYPSTLAEDPSFENLTDIKAILETARKYSLDLIEKRVCQALASPHVLETESLRCFAIARNARLKHETITAARYTLRQPLIPAWFAEIEMITSSDLLALLTYHKKCSIAVAPLLHNLDWVTSHYGSLNGRNWLVPEAKRNSHRMDIRCECARSTKVRLWGIDSLSWWATYMEETFNLLKDTPTGGIAKSEAEKAIQKVRSGNCTACSSGVKANMEEFSDLLAFHVEKATASIELELDF